MLKRKQLSLQVQEAYDIDVGLGRARIGKRYMNSLGLETGSCVKVGGKKVTYLKAVPLYPSDKGKIIRIDNLGRRNSLVKMEDNVNISKVPVLEPARNVLLKSRKNYQNWIHVI